MKEYSNYYTVAFISCTSYLILKILLGSSAVPGPRMLLLAGGLGFGGRRKAVRDRLALQGGTGDFP